MKTTRVNRSSTGSAIASGVTNLSRVAARMLACLADAGSAAVPDQTEPGTLIVRSARSGISLARGSYPEQAARELSSHDLVDYEPRSGPLRRVVISEPGKAFLRRAEAAGEEIPHLAQHREIAAVRIEGGSPLTVNAAENPLDWLRRRSDRQGEPLIDPVSYEAGERLRRDLTLGGLLPSVTARWDGAIGGGGPSDPAAATDAMIAARQRARSALAEVGSDLADLLIDLCGFLKGLETLERERGWPPRSGKVVVRLALRRLAEHYGLEAEARGPGRSRGVRIWRSADEQAASGG